MLLVDVTCDDVSGHVSHGVIKSCKITLSRTTPKHWTVHNLVHGRNGTSDTSEDVAMPSVYQINPFPLLVLQKQIKECYTVWRQFLNKFSRVKSGFILNKNVSI